MSSPDHLRIGDAERDAVTSALHDHFAQGRLTRDELDERLDTTLAAKTRADLREIVHDLPEPNGLPAAVEPTKTGYHPHHRHHHGPPFMPVLLILFIVAVATGGLGGALVIAKVFFLFWLVTTLFFMLRFRRHRRESWHRSRH